MQPWHQIYSRQDQNTRFKRRFHLFLPKKSQESKSTLHLIVTVKCLTEKKSAEATGTPPCYHGLQDEPYVWMGFFSVDTALGVHFKPPWRQPDSLNCADWPWTSFSPSSSFPPHIFRRHLEPTMQPSLTEKQHIDAKVHQHEPEPYLPTYEEATGQFDSSKLPSYSVKRRVRFHPYLRYFPVVVDRDATDRLFVCFGAPCYHLP